MMSTSVPTFSIIIPTWQNISFIKLCVDSILKNSTYTHQIVLHINDGSDGTLQWAKENNISHTHSKKNIGICEAVNSAFKLCKNEYIVYMNDDMYVCPEWDKHLGDFIKQLDTKLFMLSATMIEPRITKNKCVINADFGSDSNDFQEQKLLAEYKNLQKENWQGSTWPPCLIHRDTWEKVGGFSEEFSPGMYSDPDFSMKLWKLGCRDFIGVGKSKVYHFQSKSTLKVKKNNGRKQFLKKWGVSSSFFTSTYLKRGKKYNSKLSEPSKNIQYYWERIKYLFA